MKNKKVNLDEQTHKKVKELANNTGYLFERLLSKLVNIGLDNKMFKNFDREGNNEKL